MGEASQAKSAVEASQEKSVVEASQERSAVEANQEKSIVEVSQGRRKKAKAVVAAVVAGVKRKRTRRRLVRKTSLSVVRVVTADVQLRRIIFCDRIVCLCWMFFGMEEASPARAALDVA